MFLHVCSFSPGSVLESLNNHSKEVIPIKPLAEFLQKIVVSIAFYFQFINMNHRGESGEGVQRVCHPSPCDDLWLFFITNVLQKNYLCPRVSYVLP